MLFRCLAVAVLLSVAGMSARAQEVGSTDGRNPIEKVLDVAQPAVEGMKTVYQLDVIRYFSLLDEYDTDLKKAVFKKTPEYQALLDSLKSLKKQMLAGLWYVTVLRAPPGGWVDEAWKTTDYDMESRGVRLILGMNYGSGYAAARAPKSFGDFLFSSLPTKRVSVDPEFYPANVKEERLLLPMSEENGLAVETDEEDIAVYVLFTIVGMEEASYYWRSFGGEAYTMTDKLLTTESVRVVVANASTGDVYFNRRY